MNKGKITSTLSVLEEFEMVDGKSPDKAKSSNTKVDKKATSSKTDTFKNVVRLFRTNGLIYGSSVCTSSINPVLTQKSDMKGKKSQNKAKK